MAEPVLAVCAVTREFGPEHSRTRVLHGVDLQLAHGEFSALIGPSGSGKSSLLNIMGLLDRPSSGAVRVQGREVSQLGDRELTRLRGQVLGFVFQFHHLLPAFSALENVIMPVYAERGRLTPDDRARGRELLTQVGLAHRIDARALDLSGGEAQRVAVARALINRPALVLADEPTGNLDTQTADAIFALLRRVNRQHGITFLIVTHDPRLAARTDRIVTLVDGRVVSDQARGPTAPAGLFAPPD
jgi:lipoprotein-releasing system ATP-binding protein